MHAVYPNKSRTSVLIAGDHTIFAEALRVYLERAFTVIGVVADRRAMVQEAIRLKPDVTVADFSMPLLKWIDAARRIRNQVPNARFVFLTMHGDADFAAAALALGRAGFVLKHSSGQELIKAIEETLYGRSYLTPRLRADNWVSAQARARQFSKELTTRQCDCVQLFAEGRHIKEIAAILNMSAKTVEYHKHRIMMLFNLKSNADLVLFALKRGFITVNPEPLSTRQSILKRTSRIAAVLSHCDSRSEDIHCGPSGNCKERTDHG